MINSRKLFLELLSRACGAGHGAASAAAATLAPASPSATPGGGRAYHVARLTSRSVISLTGPDAVTFLQASAWLLLRPARAAQCAGTSTMVAQAAAPAAPSPARG